MPLKTPKTMSELENFCKSHGYTPEKSRFFINENTNEPKAYGICKDPKTGNYIVYKNKANGERSIRYEGPDEAFAVKEIFDKLTELSKGNKKMTPAAFGRKVLHILKLVGNNIYLLLCVLAALFTVVSLVMSVINIGRKWFSPSYPKGYATYNNSTYYCDGKNFHRYNDTSATWEDVYYQTQDLADFFIEIEDTIDAYNWETYCLDNDIPTDYIDYDSWFDEYGDYEASDFSDGWDLIEDIDFDAFDWDFDWDSDW